MIDGDYQRPKEPKKNTEKNTKKSDMGFDVKGLIIFLLGSKK